MTAKKGEDVGAGCGSMSLEHSRWGMNNGWEMEHALELGERELYAGAESRSSSLKCELENASWSMENASWMRELELRMKAGCASWLEHGCWSIRARECEMWVYDGDRRTPAGAENFRGNMRASMENTIWMRELNKGAVAKNASWKIRAGACAGARRTPARACALACRTLSGERLGSENASWSKCASMQNAGRRTPAGWMRELELELEFEAEGMRWRQQMLRISN